MNTNNTSELPALPPADLSLQDMGLEEARYNRMLDYLRFIPATLIVWREVRKGNGITPEARTALANLVTFCEHQNDETALQWATELRDEFLSNDGTLSMGSIENLFPDYDTFDLEQETAKPVMTEALLNAGATQGEIDIILL